MLLHRKLWGQNIANLEDGGDPADIGRLLRIVNIENKQMLLENSRGMMVLLDLVSLDLVCKSCRIDASFGDIEHTFAFAEMVSLKTKLFDATVYYQKAWSGAQQDTILKRY